MISFCSIMDKIFKELKFECFDNKDSNFRLYIFNGNAENYYLVSDIDLLLDDSFNFKVFQQEIFEKIKSYNLGPGFLKNISWLIGVNIEMIKKNNENNLMKIEEDEFCFKKTVFTYNSKSINSFFHCLNKKEKEQSLIEYLNFIINDYESYSKYYNLENRENNFYDFISKIFIKIPVIKLDIKNNDDIPSLHKLISKEIENENLKEFSEKLIILLNSSNKLEEVYDKIMDGEI